MTAIVPTLHLNTGVLKVPSDIITYLLRHYLYTPSGIYENYIEEEVTFSKTFAEHSGNIEYLKEQVNLELTSVLQRYFETDSVIVEIKSEADTNNEKAISLNIDIQVKSGDKVYSVSPSIIIDNVNNKFQIKFSDV